MKEITVTKHIAAASMYGSRFQMAFCSKPIKNKIYQLHHLIQCKDYMNEIVRDLVNSGSKTSSGHGCSLSMRTKHRLDTDNVRFIITSNFVGETESKFKTGLTSGKKILNFYETTYEFSGTTRLFEAKLPYRSKKAWLVVGPKEWISNPHLLAIYISILRATATINKKIESITSSEDIDNFFKINCHSCSDTYYFPDVYKQFNMIIKHRKELFGHLKTMKHNWPKSKLTQSNGGIYSLIRKSGYSSTINSKYEELLKNYK